MEIIPAIDLLNGNCVRLHQGDYDKVTEFNDDPVKQAVNWVDQGARRLHLVDLDAARTGLPTNDTSIRSIKEAVDIPIQIGGGVRSIERAEALLDYGIDRIIVGTIAIENPDIVNKLAEKHPGKIVVGIDAKDGKVATRGWVSESNILSTELARSFSKKAIAAIVSTDISTDGTLEGPNLESLKEIAIASEVPVIASGGVGTTNDLVSLMTLEPFGITAVIVGRALYERTIQLQEAINIMESGIVLDPPSEENYFA